MPSTRRQTARTTRSSGPASIQTGLGTSTGVKRRQTKAKSKTSSIPKPSALRSHPDNKEKIRRILWNLAEKYFPWLKIILEPFKSYNEAVVFIIIGAILLFYPFWSFRVTIMNAITVFWQKGVTADLPSVYFNDVSYSLTSCPDEDMERYEDLLKDYNGKNIFFIEGIASGREISGYANRLGVRLFDSLKQRKQDNRPVDVITINVSSESFYVMRSVYNAILALCGSQKADCIKQIKEEFDLTRDLFLSELGNSFKTEMKLKFLFTKLDELLTQRNSHAVVILYSWRRSDNTALFRFRGLSREPLTTHLGIIEKSILAPGGWGYLFIRA